MRRVPLALLLVAALPALAFADGDAAPASAAAAVESIALPGAPPEGVYLDYLAYDRAHRRVWVPAGNTGRVDVIDVKSGKLTALDGFATQTLQRNGQARIVGPSSATVGDGRVFVGSRGDFSVCSLAADSLKRGPCVKLPSMPDGVAWVQATREVWVTTPRDKSIQILDASKPAALTLLRTLRFAGEPEGFAVDEARGLFFTNLEDQDRTLAIDLKSKKTTHTWLPACGEDGPKGLALDRARDFLMVACPDRVKVLDAGHDGRVLGQIPTGDGVDNIDYLEARHELYVGAARAARLTVATLDGHGVLTQKSVVPTRPGARNAVVTDEGAAYLTDTKNGAILLVHPISH